MATRQQTPARGATFADRYGDVVANIERVIQGKPEVDRARAPVPGRPRATSSSRTSPAWARPAWPRRWRRRSTARSGGCSSPPTSCPPTWSASPSGTAATSEFEFRPGPVFSNIVLADEINRASPKTQSALLEAMAEAQVTVDGTTYHLANPFMVIATQNPIEHEGTYPLPESQLDRFLMRVSVGYPSPADELADPRHPRRPRRARGHRLRDHGGRDRAPGRRRPRACTSPRPSRATSWSWPTRHGGIPTWPSACRRGPRSALQRVARARAAAQARSYVVPDDLKALAEPVLAHRLLVTPEAQLQGITAGDALDEVLRAVPVPAGKPR